MSSAAADRNLLFAILAVQNDLVSRDDVIAAMNAWVLAKHKPIGQILVEQGAIEQEDAAVIDQMIARHIRKTGGDVSKSLENLSSAGGLASPLAAIGDTDLSASISLCADIPTVVVNPQAQNAAGQILSPGADSPAAGPVISDPDDEDDQPENPNISPAPEPQVGDVIGRFRIVRLIGKGGQGVVYEALDLSELNRTVALKTTIEGRDDKPEILHRRRTRLLREGRLNARLEHPFIIPISGLGTTETGRPYYAMRFLDQINLETAIRNFHQRLPLLHGPRAEVRAKPAAEDAASTQLPAPQPPADHAAETHVAGQGLNDAAPQETGKATAASAETVFSTAEPSADRGPIRLDRLQGERNLDFRNLLERFTDVCDAIHFAHTRRVLHRDLKPGNIMLGSHGETLVIDWGMAKTRAEIQAEALKKKSAGDPATISLELDARHRMSVAGRFIGTPGFAPPEQLAGDLTKLNETTDVYALGCILYDLLTGMAPFIDAEFRALDSSRWLEWLIAKTATAPDPLAVNATIPKPLAAICRKALGPAQADRYPTAAALSEDVNHWLADEPVSAYRDTLRERAMRWTRKNRGKAATIAATFVVGTLASGAGLIMQASYAAELERKNVEITEERNRAIAQEGRAIRNEQAAERLRQFAEINEKRAYAREKIAIDAVKKFSDAVSINEQLKNSPELEELRKELLKSPIEFYRKLRDDLQASRDTRPESLSSLAVGLCQLASLTAEIGDIADANNSYSQAVEIYDSLVQANPSVTEFRSNLAYALSALAAIEQNSKHYEAGSIAFKKSINHYKLLVEANPQNIQFRAGLAYGMLGLGSIALNMVKSEESKEVCERSIALWESVVRIAPSNTGFRNGLAFAFSNLGRLESINGNDEAARVAYELSITNYAALETDHAAKKQYFRLLGNMHNSFAWFLASRSFREPKDYVLAVTLAEEASKMNPDNAETVKTLGMSIYRAEKYAKAAETLTKSVEMNKQAAKGIEQPADLAFLAMAQWKLDRKPEAEAVYARLVETMKRPEFARDREARQFFREATNLIRPMMLPEDPFQP